ncbi:hypothetical protein K8R30_02690 [archaeon]|nr:hypothetical protein [archaeon]
MNGELYCGIIRMNKVTGVPGQEVVLYSEDEKREFDYKTKTHEKDIESYLWIVNPDNMQTLMEATLLE